MADKAIHAVTGAYGYSGKYIAQRLLDEGQTVITLTNSLSRSNPFGDRIKAFPFHFDQPDLLAEHLKGVSVLYNTYWVRFNHRLFKHADAVRNTLILFEAAKKAGVQRIVHVSITNPSEDSPLEYFRGKAVLEKALIESRHLLCHPSPRGSLRERGHPDQQHRLGLAAASGVRSLRRRALPFAADLRRRPGGPGRRARQEA